MTSWWRHQPWENFEKKCGNCYYLVIIFAPKQAIRHKISWTSSLANLISFSTMGSKSWFTFYRMSNHGLKIGPNTTFLSEKDTKLQRSKLSLWRIPYLVELNSYCLWCTMCCRIVFEADRVNSHVRGHAQNGKNLQKVLKIAEKSHLSHFWGCMLQRNIVLSYCPKSIVLLWT